MSLVTVAVLLRVPVVPLFMVTLMVIKLELPAVSVPRFYQDAASPAIYGVCVHDVLAIPAGRVSVTLTLSASLGPWLVMLRV